MKLHATDDRTIDFIQFKNIKIALDMDVYIFFGNIDKNNNTFSYDGNFINLSYIYGEEVSFEAIENNGVNSL